jgi:hypothetical protein
VPYFAPRGAPRPELVEGPPTPHEALRARLDAARREALAAFRQRPQVTLVGRNELDAINADLDEVQRLNAALPHNMRSDWARGWPTPVFKPTAIHAWRDLYAALATADRVLSAVRADAMTWRANDGGLV